MASKKSARSNHTFLVLLMGLAACALAWYWQFGRIQEPDVTASPAAVQSSVRLNEMMSANKSAVPDNEGNYSDWIEVINAGSESADITGWKISDGSGLFTFPEHILAPGETVLVYASGTAHALPGEAYHAGFKLSASGESITLTDDREQTVDAVDLPALDADTAYARNADGGWAVTAAFTPGLANDESYEAIELALADGKGLILNEIMTDSRTYALDMDGEACDYIELANVGSSPLSLAGYGLTDDAASPAKWLLPDVTLQPGEYLLIRASGKDRVDGELHTSFRLSEGEGVILTDPRGRIIDRAVPEALEPDQSLSLNESGEWTGNLAPTPAYANDQSGAGRVDSELRSRNVEQVVINELVCSTRVISDEDTETSYDWVELHNASASLVDLSGWGLSDNAGRPRKWQFPAGTTIGPGQYMVIYLSGKDTMEGGHYHTNFSLSLSQTETLTLCRPDGSLVDRMPLRDQHAEISVGRAPAQSGFFLFETPTPGSANSGESYFGRAQQVAFSEDGGLKDGPVQLTLTAGPGETIYYTTDSTDPTSASIRYTGPITISETTVIRAVACRTGYLDSISNTRTYLVGVSHTLPVVCLTSDPDGMFGEENGMYVNIDHYWSRAAFIEYYSLEGETILSQGVDISLHGNDARTYQQKTMNVIARSVYGDNRLRAALFPNRDYTEYQSILLRPSSEDGNYTRMRCSVLSTLCADTTVMYQDVAVAILYINGEYWGHYNLRERVNAHAIAQWEGWTEPDLIDLVKSNDHVKQGSNSTFRDLMNWIEENGVRTQENLDYVNTIVDVENYLDYVMVEMFVANSDLLNVKRYRSVEGDGRWKWAIFDLDWAFHNDSNSYTDWLSTKGAGMQNATDNRLFVALMKNDSVKEYFLRTLGERMATCWRSEALVNRIDERQALLEPEMPQSYTRWGNSLDRWYEKTAEMRQYAIERPSKLISYIAEAEDMSEAEIQDYFGAALAANPPDAVYPNLAK